MAVCDKTFRILTDAKGPYAADVLLVPPLNEVPLEQAGPFACTGSTVRHPRQTKGQDYSETRLTEDGPCCDGEGCC